MRYTTMRVKFSMLIFIGLVLDSNAQVFQSSHEDFLKMAKYLSDGSGKWMAPNPNYDSTNPSSHEALGLWFDLKYQENLLHLSIVAYRRDTVHISSHAMWIWHPGEQRIKYYDINLRGYFIDGETYFTSPDVFVTRSFTYTPNGDISFASGENRMTSENEHYTESRSYKDGVWKIQGSFTWKKVSDNEGYKIIKEY